MPSNRYYIGERSEIPLRPQKMILELLNARSEQAIEELRTHYGGLCRSIARRVLDSPEDIEEILNDTLLAVWNQIPPDQPLSLSGYISRITRNLSLTRFRDSTADVRNKEITVCLSELELCLSDASNLETQLEGRQITAIINGYLATLSKQNRIIFVRRYYCMDSTRQISELTGMTDTAIRSRLLRMRAQLRQLLEMEGIII